MSERKSFLLRVDRELLDAVQRWAGDDLRSLNGQIEFLLRRALGEAGRLPGRRGPGAQGGERSTDQQHERARGQQNERINDDRGGRSPGEHAPDDRPRDVDATGEP